jgi:hydrogenase maturation factor HypF (carbamoyltransferase family)
MHNLTTFITCDDCGRRLCVSKADYDRLMGRLVNVTCDRCGSALTIFENVYDKRIDRGWSIFCSDCDNNMGLHNVSICCSECDSKNGLRVKYAVPSLTDIINSIE